jgi:hypothetical protein
MYVRRRGGRGTTSSSSCIASSYSVWNASIIALSISSLELLLDEDMALRGVESGGDEVRCEI